MELSGGEKQYNRMIAVDRLAQTMVKLFTTGHDAEQTPEYNSVQSEYIRMQKVNAWGDIAPPNNMIG